MSFRDQIRTAVLALIADAVEAKGKGKAAPKGRRGNPEALARWREQQKAAKAETKAAPKAKAKAKAKPKAEGVECGPGEFRKGATTQAGREYVLIYVEGEYFGAVRVDNPALLKQGIATLACKDAAAAIELACE